MKEWYVYVNEWTLHGTRVHRYLPHATCHFRVACGDRVYHLTSEWWVGIWLSAITVRGEAVLTAVRPHIPVRRPIVKKKTAAAAAGDGARHLAKLDSKIFVNREPLVEHCAVTRYDDGDAREPGWFTVKTLGAAWVVQVKDPDTGNSFQFVSESLDGAIDGACLLLACEEAPWQPDAFLKAKKRK